MGDKVKLDRSKLLGFDHLDQNTFEAVSPDGTAVPPSLSAKVSGKPAPAAETPDKEDEAHGYQA